MKDKGGWCAAVVIELLQGDCLDVMGEMEANSVDTIVTDPPYGLEFMGKDWDHGVPGVRFWTEALRVAKPGAMLLAFGGTRTHHRLMCAIEDAGWEIRDCLMWLYGSGFPKSHDISKGIDKAAGAEREVIGRRAGWSPGRKPCDRWREFEGRTDPAPSVDKWDTSPATDAAHLWDGWGTALKPAWEPIILAMKPRDGTFANNALQWGVAGLWVDGARVATNGDKPNGGNYGEAHGTQIWGNAGSETTFRQAMPTGRWPANLILDEAAGAMLDEQSGERPSGGSEHERSLVSGNVPLNNAARCPDTGGASRFFYCAKASRAERNAGLEEREKHTLNDYVHPSEGRTAPKNGSPMQNHHPTVKPLDLMRYLVRLTRTPTGGVVLDPFMGSGTTGMACVLEGRDFIGIELDADYLEIARRRIAWAQEQVPEAVQGTLWP